MARKLRTTLPQTNTLKIDKDCFVNSRLNMEYVRTVLHTCRKYGVTIQWIRYSKSRHGMHFYIRIKPSLSPKIANNLQYLLGDDAKRVEFNRARIESGLAEWNKLFEKPNVKLNTIYHNYSTKVADTDIEVESFRFTA